MKLFLATLLMFCVLSMAVFGFLAMGSHNSEHGNCIARTLQGAACTATDIFGVASYHLSAFQKAAGAALPGAIALLTPLIVLFSLALFGETFAAPNLRQKFCFYLSPEDFSPPQKISLWRWLSFHENSPNAVLAR